MGEDLFYIIFLIVIVGSIYGVIYLITYIITYISHIFASKSRYRYEHNKGQGRRVDKDSVRDKSIILTIITIIGLVMACLISYWPELISPHITPTNIIANPPATDTPSVLHPSKTPTPNLGTYETAWQDDSRFRTLAEKRLIRVGALMFEYAPIMQLQTSETFYLMVYVPQEYASADPFSFERISLPTHRLNPINTLSRYTTSLLVYPTIGAQLESTDFRILPVDRQSTKFLDVSDQGAMVDWKWIVQAPGISGKHILALSIFIDTIPDPSWTGSFTIEVQTPTATPMPTNTFTPQPTRTFIPTETSTISPTVTSTSTPTVLQDFGDNLKQNFTNILLWALGILVGVGSAAYGSIYKLSEKHLKRADEIKELGNQLNTLKQEKERMVLVNDIQKLSINIKELEEKIRKLKSISWWQFWK